MSVDAVPIPPRREVPGGTRYPPVMTTTVWNAGQKSVVAVHATEHTPSRWAYASD